VLREYAFRQAPGDYQCSAVGGDGFGGPAKLLQAGSPLVERPADGFLATTLTPYAFHFT
jgi:hypothetical protein